MFVDYDLKICSELTLPVNHNLMAKSRNVKIKRIYSHPQVFGQCRRWIQMNYPDAQLIDVDTTTVAAKMVKQKEGSAAIASSLAASIYDLVIIHNNIQDMAHNMTRFLIIGNHFSKKSGQDKTSLLFSLKDEVGILYEALKPFKKYSVNLSKIESRPSKRKAWEYLFFVDLDGHYHDPKVKKAIEELEKSCNFLKILGAYPKEV